MNKHIHRLVFDRLRGMRVPAAETARASGKAAGGQSRAVAVAGLAVVSLAAVGLADARDVAAPSVNRSIGDTMMRSGMFTLNRSQGPVWNAVLDAGKSSQFKVSTGVNNTLIDQYDNRVTINWDSFNLGADYSVRFNQPTGGSAYNIIWDLNPTVIMGKITANGEVILQNTNGVIFGSSARVQTGKFVTTALKMTQEAIDKGLRANRKGEVMFGGDDANPLGFITIERGAEIKALAGGDVLMIAPKVFNEGTIETPKGQTVLAAGQKVYLYTTVDPAQRGLLVAVDPFAAGPAGINTVENAESQAYGGDASGIGKKVNQIVAEQGSINLVGLTVRNNGILTATTAVKGQNGAIYLQAQKTTAGVERSGNDTIRVQNELGSVELGAGSLTQVLPSVEVVKLADGTMGEATQTAAETFNRSRIDITGADVLVRGGATVRSPFGNISILAAKDASQTSLLGDTRSSILAKDSSRIVVEDGALITAAGLRNVALPMSRNQISGRLFANELADSPVQRGGVLYREGVNVDARMVTTVANVKGFYNSIGRTAQEYVTQGGSVRIMSGGTTVISDGAKIDVSGGSVAYQAGTLTSSLLRKGDSIVRVEDASAGTRYDELIQSSDRQGAVEQAAYIEGKDAGDVQLVGQQFYLGEGTLKGDVVLGAAQRAGLLSSQIDLSARPDLYASIRPKAAGLTLGYSDDARSFMNAVQIVQTVTGTNTVSASTLSAGGFGDLTVYAQGLQVDSAAQLNLAASGQFKAVTVSGIHVDGAVRIAAGTIDLKGAGVSLGQGATLDVSGTNLDEYGRSGRADAVNVQGGQVSLNGEAVDLKVGSTIDVSAGAWRSTSGIVSKGSAGSVTLNVGELNAGTLALNGSLRGFDFQSGGTLKIAGVTGVAIGSPAKLDDLFLNTAFFEDNGFGTFDLRSRGDVTVAADTRLAPRLRNMVLNSGRTASSGALFGLTQLEDGLRSPIALSLTAVSPSVNNSAGYKEGGRVVIGERAAIDVGAGGAFTAVAGRQVLVSKDASITAHGGAVKLTLKGVRGSAGITPGPDDDQIGYIADQEIRVSQGARIDVSGIAKTVSQTLGGQTRVTGSVLGGGSVTLNLDAGNTTLGRVVTEVGSLIDVSGQSADLNVSRGNLSTRVSKGAGSVSVGGADGFALMGDMQAHAPDSTVGAGQFTASVSREGRNDLTNPSVDETRHYTQADRVLLVTDKVAGVEAAAASYGTGAVSSEQLAAAGFDRIALRADDRVVLGTGASLGTAPGQALRAIVVSSPVLRAQDAGAHELRASYVSLGDRDINVQPGVVASTAALPQAVAGQANLTVNAGLIEVHGRSALQGWQKTQLNATLDKAMGLTRQDGEIRFIGRTLDGGSNKLVGYLGFDGELTMQAGQAYASTLSEFVVQGQIGNSKLVTKAPSAGASTSVTPLSALASLTLQADDIQHDGVLRQPFGSLTLNAVNKVTLGAGSILSVSGDGVTVPVGSTVNERTWQYATQGATTDKDAPGVLTLDGLPVAKGIAVKGKGLTISSQALIQAQAGGDLQASEFIKGVGGSTDTLNRKNLFAVLPTYAYDFAPYDTEIAKTAALQGSGPKVGDKIVITTSNGVLAEGSYTLLPARYALLPGAVLVSPADIKATGTLSRAIVQDDGSVYVSGQMGAVGTGINGGDNRQTFLLESAATYLAKSAYALTSVNKFLTDRAEQLDKPIPSLAGDAGRSSFVSQEAFKLDGVINLAGKDRFASGQLDLSLPSMVLTDGSQTLEAGASTVSVQALNATGAGSILLGGTREGTAEGSTITTTAHDVRVAAGQVSAGELLLVATDNVVVDDGVVIAAKGAVSNKANQLNLKGHGAALVVSQNLQTDIRRDLKGAVDTGGTLKVGKATLKGAAVQLDATKRLALDPDLVIASQQFGLAAPRIVIGGAADGTDAVSLDGALLDTVKSATSMQLRSYSSIDFKGGQAFDVRRPDGAPRLSKVVLDAPQLRGLGQSGDVVRVTAQDITLRNTSGLKASVAEQGSSQLVIRAEPPKRDTITGGLTVGEGEQRLAFTSASLQSKGDIVFDGQGKLATQGDVTLSAARVTATSSAKHGVDSQGVLTVTAAADARTLGERRGAGGALSLTGQRVVQDGMVDVASGKINIVGTGKDQQGRRDTVTLTERSVTRAAGWAQQVSPTWAVYAPGGDVTVNAQQGDLIWRGQIDVQAPVHTDKPDQGQAAGTVKLTAQGVGPDGYVGQFVVGKQASLKGGAGSDRLSASLSVDAQMVKNEATTGSSGTLDRLADIAMLGGVRREVDLRVRQGSHSLNTNLSAQRVFISADEGSLTLGGKIDARSPQGGVVQLASGQDLIVQANAQVLADSSRAGANGGDILLASADGQVRIKDGATLSAGGDDQKDGRVIIRAQRDDAVDVPDNVRVNVDAIGAATKITAGEITVEATRIYNGNKLSTGKSTGSTIGQSSLYADNVEFMTHQGSVLEALGLQDRANVHLRSGVEIRSTGDFEVSKDWNLWTADRPGGEPLNLTIRAAGDLNIKGSLSDGFDTASRTTTGDLPTDIKVGAAASFRLVAGADMTAANVLKTKTDTDTGSLRIDGGKMVRTTAGSIELAAAKDIELKAGTGSKPVQAVVYVAGERAADLLEGQSFTAPNDWAQFTDHGGRLAMLAGGNIKSPAAAQLIGNWFHHTGPTDTTSGAWYSFFDGFKQGVGSFGGGNVSIVAGGSISNIGVVLPTSARLIAQNDVTELKVDNGGDLNIKAGGDIRGGVYFLGRGQGLIQSDGAVTVGDSANASIPQIGAVVALMDGQLSIQAHDDVVLASVFNPTAMSNTARVGDAGASYFTYAPTTSLALTSTAGQVKWAAESAPGTAQMSSYYKNVNLLNASSKELDSVTTGTVVERKRSLVAAPNMALTSLQGDVVLDLPGGANLTMFPSDTGQLDVYAGQDVLMRTVQTGGSALTMADGALADWPTIASPVWDLFGQPNLNPRVLHQNDAVPIHIHAERDVLTAATDSKKGIASSGINVPKAAEITAGRDIVNLSFTGQHYRDSDVTRIEAGRNVMGINGTFSPKASSYAGLIQLSGPGELQVLAGRQLDLGSSGGIRTVGNVYNGALPETSASIKVAAGQAKTLVMADFAARYLPEGAQARAQLVSYVKQVLHLLDADLPVDPAAAFGVALGYFNGLTSAHQVRFAQQVMDQGFADKYLQAGGTYAQVWLNKAAALNIDPKDLSSMAFGQFKDDVLMGELARLGQAAAAVPQSVDPVANAEAKRVRQAFYDEAFNAISLAGQGSGFDFVGDIQVAASGIQTSGKGRLGTGGIDLFAPGGQIVVGLNALTDKQKLAAKDHGLITYGGGSIRAMSDSDYLVNAQKTFVVGSGDILLWSSNGSIDAGRGANTDVTVPPPIAKRDADGVVTYESPAVTTGSGIGRLKPAEGASDGVVGLYAPNGEIRALDAQIRNEGGGAINIGAQLVKGADNLSGKVSGGPAVVAVNVAVSVNTSLPSQTAAGAQVAAAGQDAKAKEPSSIVTVDLLGDGDELPAPAAGAAGAPSDDLCRDGKKPTTAKGEEAAPNACGKR